MLQLAQVRRLPGLALRACLLRGLHQLQLAAAKPCPLRSTQQHQQVGQDLQQQSSWQRATPTWQPQLQLRCYRQQARRGMRPLSQAAPWPLQ